MSRSPISWNPNQQKRLRDAVQKYNAAVTRMERSGKYDYVPAKTSYQEEHDRIYTRDQLYSRERQLGRILKKNNPQADVVVEVEGVTVPKYLKDEIRYTRQMRDETIKARREELFGDFDSMTNMEKATLMANKNLGPVDEEYEYDYEYPTREYFTPDDYMEILAYEYPDTALYIDQYLTVWDELGGSGELADILNRFLNQNPEALVNIFDSGDVRVEIEYIYPDKPLGSRTSSRGYKYDRLSAFQDSWQDRADKVLEFWKQMEKDYLD